MSTGGGQKLRWCDPVDAFVLPLPPKEQATHLQYELKCYFYWLLILLPLSIFSVVVR